MTSQTPASSSSWTLSPASTIATAFYVVRTYTHTDQRPILVLPNCTRSQEQVLQDSRRRSPISLSEHDSVQKCQLGPEPYVLDIYPPCIFRVPSQYLQAPLKDVDTVIPRHWTTPHRPAGNGTLTIPVYLHTPMLFLHYRSLPALFSLEHHIFKMPLCARITQRTKICLESQKMQGEYEQAYPKFSVVGSLGLYKERLGEEVLLLKAEGVTRSHPYQYIRLRVHVTHVSPDVGFVLTAQADWRFAASIMARMRAQEDSHTALRDNLMAQELVYAYTVVCLREQACTYP